MTGDFLEEAACTSQDLSSHMHKLPLLLGGHGQASGVGCQRAHSWNAASTVTSATNALTVPPPASYSAAMLALPGLLPMASSTDPGGAPALWKGAAARPASAPPRPNSAPRPAQDVFPLPAVVAPRSLAAIASGALDEHTTATGAVAAEVTAVTEALAAAAYAMCSAKKQQLLLCAARHVPLSIKHVLSDLSKKHPVRKSLHNENYAQ